VHFVYNVRTLCPSAGDEMKWPAAEFWKRYDKGEFKK